MRSKRLKFLRWLRKKVFKIPERSVKYIYTIDLAKGEDSTITTTFSKDNGYISKDNSK